MVEFDVQMDAAGRLLLLHDDNFKRTAGIQASVFELDDVTQISVHEPKRLGDTFKPEAVPELAQVLVLLLEYPAATAFVEIKDESLQRWGISKVIDEALASVAVAKQQCVIISDNLDALLYVKARSDYRIGWVIHRYDDACHRLARQHQPEFLLCNYKRIKNTPWPGNWQWMLYDISDPELAMVWANKGVDLIETRDIGTLLQHPQLKQRSCRRG
jgi:glycerophosphoryl diester phosphodiesterase